ncbi:MAG: hypothetical protein KBS41_04555 [Oscillospiraceae bacterium]|nr:hypothetical protein [Candidatus Equicaccousia limihippi]
MIEIITENDRQKVKAVCDNAKVSYGDSVQLINCTDKSEVLGYALASFEKNATVLYAKFCDTVIFDGLIRTVIHLASEKLIENTFYSNKMDEDLLQKLGFIQNKDKKLLKPLSFMEKPCEKM